jgi:hypothetical protein
MVSIRPTHINRTIKNLLLIMHRRKARARKPSLCTVRASICTRMRAHDYFTCSLHALQPAHRCVCSRTKRTLITEHPFFTRRKQLLCRHCRTSNCPHTEERDRDCSQQDSDAPSSSHPSSFQSAHLHSQRRITGANSGQTKNKKNY